MTKDSLFASCQDYELDEAFAVSAYTDGPSCIICAHQYTDRVCQVFRRRLVLRMLGEPTTTTKEGGIMPGLPDDEGLFDDPMQAVEEVFLKAARWRLAKSLVNLLAEANAYAPKRSKSIDGTIGDAAHAARASRHNPNNNGVVCALDLTHDPAGGFDAHAIARELTKHPHPNLYYIISNRQGAYRKEGFKWRKYGGSHPHDHHIHVAVGLGPDSEPTPPYDDPTPWGLASGSDLPEVVIGSRILRLEEPLMRGTDVKHLQQKLRACLIDVGKADGIYGILTRGGVVELQKRCWPKTPKEWDGKVGDKTWTALAEAETGAQFIDRVWLKPRNSLMRGDMFTEGFLYNYGIELHWSMAIIGAETSLGRPEDALSHVFNWGCIKWREGIFETKWGELANKETVKLNGKEWLTFPSAWDGVYAWGRLIKLEYLPLLKAGGVAAAAPKYYGVDEEGYEAYLAKVTTLEKKFKASIDAYKRGAA